MVTAQGRFSILSNRWIQPPADQPEIDTAAVEAKADRIRRTIEAAIELDDQDRLESLMKRLKAFRDDGIDDDGEFSFQNQVYKELRRSGALNRLKQAALREYDEALSYACACEDNQPQRYAKSDWIPYTGPAGGKGWQHIHTGRIEYGDEQPGADGGDGEPDMGPEHSADATDEPDPWDTPAPAAAAHAPTGQPPPPIAPPAPDPNLTPAERAVQPPQAQWQSVKGASGEQLWRHPHTGETVLAKEAPSRSKAADVIAKARAGGGPKKPDKPKPAPSPEPKAAAQPTPAPAAAPPPPAKPAATGSQQPQSPPAAAPKPASKPPGDHPAAKQVNALPDGAQLFGYTKETPKGLGMSVWTHGDDALGTNQLLEEHSSPEHKAELDTALQPQAADDGGESGDSGSTGPVHRDYTNEESASVHSAAAIFGIAPGDLGEHRQQSNFLLRTARNVGFNPSSVAGDRTDKTVAAAKYLASRQPHLQAVVKMARGYGWGGGSGRELAHTARHAGLHLVKAAAQRGHDPEGNTEAEHIAGAISFLQQHEQKSAEQQHSRKQDVTQSLHQLFAHVKSQAADYMSGRRKITFMDIALAVIGFYAGYQMVRRLKRRLGGRRR